MRDFSPAKYEKWKRRLAYALGKVGRANEAEDAVNEFCARMLEGKSQHQTIDQFAIDYLRESSGRKGTRGYLAKQKLINAGSYEQADLRGQLKLDPRSHVDARIDLERYGELAGYGRDGITFRKYYLGGFNLSEIAEDFGITESRASQLLSKAEREVARLLKQGLANKEIADRLFVSEKTVKFHLTNIYQKCDVHTRAEFIATFQEPINEVIEVSSENWGPLPAKTAPPVSKMPAATGQDNVTFVVNTFGINETIKNLQTMSTEVTKGDYSVEKVMAACQCIGRMNETIQTVMKAAQVLNGR